MRRHPIITASPHAFSDHEQRRAVESLVDAANCSEIARVQWFGPDGCLLSTTATAPTQLGWAATTGQPAVSFPNAGTPTIGWTAPVPRHGIGRALEVRLWTAPSSAGAGSVVWVVSVESRIGGESIILAGATITNTTLTIAQGGVANIEVCTVANDVILIPRTTLNGDVRHTVKVRRQAANANDTYAGAAYFTGLELAWMG